MKELEDAINSKNYLLAGAYLAQHNNINFLVDGESIGHLLANDHNFLNSCSNKIYNNNFSLSDKNKLIEYLSNMYPKQKQSDIIDSLYIMAEAAQAKLRHQLKNLISLGYNPNTKNTKSVKAIDLNPDLFEPNYLTKKMSF